ncbi:unnamed protein product [Citrullus colocynthis]|uniref:Uncharacterized protein n=1 Tax=Citrullus colocynthis TaxID=252529 RepID=A0ABP0Z8K3_9ROSI
MAGIGVYKPTMKVLPLRCKPTTGASNNIWQRISGNFKSSVNLLHLYHIAAMMVKKTSNSSEKSFMSIKQGDVKILELSWTTQTHSGFQQMISNNPNSIYFSARNILKRIPEQGLKSGLENLKCSVQK